MRVTGQDLRTDGRFHRQTLIEWWDQERLAAARVLVIGAGATGNEVLKNLALLGAGRVVVCDMDSIEQSNLSRAVLFRESDEGTPKAEAAAHRMRELHPDGIVVALTDNISHRGGLGLFLWAEIVIGCVDNREARIFINSACARTRRIWVDGAIESLSGVVRVFDPANGACYECTMNETDRKLVAERRSCALLARNIAASGHVPTTAVAAAWVGAIQTQEAVKILHGQPALSGAGIHFNGMWNEISKVSYPRRDDCPGHDSLEAAVPLGVGVNDITFGALVERARDELGDDAVLDFSRDVIVGFECPECGATEPAGAVVGALSEKDAACPQCATHRIVEIASSAGNGGPVALDRTPGDIGLPPYDIMVARCGLAKQRAWLFDGDAAAVLGPLEAV